MTQISQANLTGGSEQLEFSSVAQIREKVAPQKRKHDAPLLSLRHNWQHSQMLDRNQHIPKVNNHHMIF